MKLASIADLRNRLLADTNDPINNAVDMALLAATPHVETLLRGTLTRTTRKDLFYIDFAQMPQRYDRTQLLMTQGWVDTTQPIEVKFDVEQDTIDDQTALDAKFYRMSKDEHGKLLIFGSDLLRPAFFRHHAHFTATGPFTAHAFGATLNNFYVQVEYTAGLTTRSDPEGGAKMFRDVPDWLKEVAVQVGRELYLKNVDVLEKDVERATTMLSNTRGIAAFLTMAERMVQPYVRFWPAWQSPMFSDVVTA